MAKLIEQIDKLVDVIPNDSQDLVPAPAVLTVEGTAGIIRITPHGMTDGQFVDIGYPANTFREILVKRVWNTGTTATGIKAGYNTYK